jgi:threonine/homoserine/homoserine lactone efflux protein
MSELLPKLIVVGLGAAVSPVAVMVLLSLMFRKKPVKNALLFLLGFTLVLVAIGVAGLFLIHLRPHSQNAHVDGYIDIALGVLCLLLIPLAWRRKSKPEETEARELKAWKAFTTGAATMIVNSSTIVLYLAGVHMIREAGLDVSDEAMALIVLVVVTLLTLIIPIVLYVVFPKTAERALSAARTWLSKNQKYVGAAILLIFGVYLLIKGIRVVL